MARKRSSGESTRTAGTINTAGLTNRGPERLSSVIGSLGASGLDHWSPGAEVGALEDGHPVTGGSAFTRSFRSPPSAPVQLITTKLYVPRTGAHLLMRPRLLERLTESVGGPLTLLVAPAGWGKTTVLSEWRASPAGSVWPVGWVSLDAGDNDPVRFWTYVLSALNQASPGVADAALALLHGAQPPAIGDALTFLLNALIDLPGDVVLVLDDYHLVTAEVIHTGLATLIDHQPPRLHLVVASRQDLSLSLARLRLRGALGELRAADLRFTPEEVAAFLTETVGLSLSPEAIAALEARSEGWIAGLQLAALSAQGRSPAHLEAFIRQFTGSNRYVVDYLIEEVLARQPAQVQDFLLRSSVLDRFCAPLYAMLLTDPAATPSSDALAAHHGEPRVDMVDVIGGIQAMLERLEHANLFLIPLDDDRQWYRYHHLFADALRNRLHQLHPELAAELHRRASVWFEAEGFAIEAVQHALAAQNVEWAAELTARHGITIGIAGEWDTVLGWLRALPPPAARARPRLEVCHALMLYCTNRPEAVEGRLRMAEATIDEAVEAADQRSSATEDRLWERAPESILADEARAIHGMAAALRANLAGASGDMAESIALGRQALALLPENEVMWRGAASLCVVREFWVTGDVTPAAERALVQVRELVRAERSVSTLASSVNLATMHILQGRLRDALAVLAEVAHMLPEVLVLQNVFNGVGYSITLGDVLRERNELDAAERYLVRGIDLNPKALSMPIWVITRGYIALAKLQQARGYSTEALATFDAFAEVARRRYFAPDLRRRVAAVRAQLQLWQGNLAAAAHWVETTGLIVDDTELPYLREQEYLTLVRVYIAQGRNTPTGHHLNDALRLLERLEREAEPMERRSSVLEIRILRALALQAQGRRAAALAALTRAVELAEPEGYVRLFADEGVAMATLLSLLLTAIRQRRIAATDASSAYVHTLLVACGSSRVEPAGGALSASLVSNLPASTVQPLATSAGGSTITSAMGNQAQVAALAQPLTAREVEVLRLLGEGAANADIARILVLNVSTVKKHVYNICNKLNAQNRTQAVAYARTLHLL